jgi:hypothetical protein
LSAAILGQFPRFRPCRFLTPVWPPGISRKVRD